MKIENQKSSEGRGTNSYSFSLQYISLMLIVLCFVLGSVTREKIKNNNPENSAESQISPDSTALVFDKVFVAGKIDFSSDGIGALEMLLSSHDVGIEIKIGASEPSHSMSSEELAIARAVALHKHFEKIGIPKEAINIYTVPRLSEGQIHFFLSKYTEAKDV
ncbi:MAG: hypothetical protein KDD56_02065 [Bdellovibrionales bacterium]|nr:hypothetical protein [Bdellovibrionales bacterium]